MGIDLGTKRIGVAISDSGVLATPHSVLEHPGDEGILAERLHQLSNELDVQCFVLGLPRRRMPGHPSEEKYRHFADLLRQKTCREVVLWDETLSTVEAGRALTESGRRWKKQKSLIDMAAAAVILQSYLDAQDPAED